MPKKETSDLGRLGAVLSFDQHERAGVHGEAMAHFGYEVAVDRYEGLSEAAVG